MNADPAMLVNSTKRFSVFSYIKFAGSCMPLLSEVSIAMRVAVGFKIRGLGVRGLRVLGFGLRVDSFQVLAMAMTHFTQDSQNLMRSPKHLPLQRNTLISSTTERSVALLQVNPKLNLSKTNHSLSLHTQSLTKA